VHKWHCQERASTSTQGGDLQAAGGGDNFPNASTSTRGGDLRAAGGGDNFPNDGDGDVASIDIGGEAAAFAGERSKATMVICAEPHACSKTFLRAARQAHAPKSLLGCFESAGNCTTPSVAAAHGMGTMPLVGIIQRI